ncbi:MAG TPA: LacI family DNA-binding transcriptional regulator [Ignavibacteriaceae bacterium]|nr:LacI family DNA-binding transcriptional regulator [Ignavibacteriaceae bacterium]
MPIVNQTHIAKKLKISRATVSKALSNADDISEGTKKRVRDLAEKDNYIPHYHASNLQSKRTNTIGVVVPDISNSFFPFVIDGIMDVAQNSGYHIILTVSREKADLEKKNILNLLSMRVDGILLAVSKETRSTEVFEKVRRSEIPIVFYDRTMDNLGFSTVRIDDRAAARKLIDFVIQSGIKEIGHLAGSSIIGIGRDRCAGYIDALKNNKISIRDEWIIEGGFTRMDGYHGFKQLQGKGTLPKVIFAANDQIALGVYDAVREIGFKIPDDISVVAFGHHDFANVLSPSLTIINVNPFNLGKKAMELMIQQINKQKSTQNLFIPAEIEIGASLCIPKAVDLSI